MAERNALLSVDDLRVEFSTRRGTVYAVNGISFDIAAGETLGIVGESGCGKSVTSLALLGILPRAGRVASGTAHFEGRDLLQLSDKELRRIRGREIAMIFQDPMTSLNPVLTVGRQIREALETHFGLDRKPAEARAAELLDQVGIPAARSRVNDYPHQFSGGMRQRAMIAMALACEPQLLIADEPTTALDVTVQMQILALLAKLREKRNMSIVMITHDFGVATNFCDRIIVMYAGKVMESAPVRDFLRRPAHPYTIGLKESVIEVGDRGRPLRPIPGMAQPLTAPPTSCPYAARCTFAIERCRTELPALRPVTPGHLVACHRAEEVMERAS